MDGLKDERGTIHFKKPTAMNPIKAFLLHYPVLRLTEREREREPTFAKWISYKFFLEILHCRLSRVMYYITTIFTGKYMEISRERPWMRLCFDITACR